MILNDTRAAREYLEVLALGIEGARYVDTGGVGRLDVLRPDFMLQVWRDNARSPRWRSLYMRLVKPAPPPGVNSPRAHIVAAWSMSEPPTLARIYQILGETPPRSLLPRRARRARAVQLHLFGDLADHP